LVLGLLVGKSVMMNNLNPHVGDFVAPIDFLGPILSLYNKPMPMIESPFDWREKVVEIAEFTFGLYLREHVMSDTNGRNQRTFACVLDSITMKFGWCLASTLQRIE
jgi:hypothetical protein